ncbi:MAG: hypothetical protein AAB395_02825, partial [Patescibacteria group bacterium]
SKQFKQLSSDGQFPSQPWIIKRLGAIEKFYENCGIEKKKDWSEYTNEELVELAKSLSSKRLPLDTINELSKEKRFPSPSYIYKRFGSLVEFHKACGFEVKKDWSKLTNQELIRLAQELGQGQNLTFEKIKKMSTHGKFPSPHLIYQRFGSLPNFQEACRPVKKDV